MKNKGACWTLVHSDFDRAFVCYTFATSNMTFCFLIRCYLMQYMQFVFGNTVCSKSSSDKFMRSRLSVFSRSKRATWTVFRFFRYFLANRWAACTALVLDMFLTNPHLVGRGYPAVADSSAYDFPQSLISTPLDDLESTADESDWPVRWAFSYITFPSILHLLVKLEAVDDDLLFDLWSYVIPNICRPTYFPEFVWYVIRIGHSVIPHFHNCSVDCFASGNCFVLIIIALFQQQHYNKKLKRLEIGFFFLRRSYRDLYICFNSFVTGNNKRFQPAIGTSPFVFCLSIRCISVFLSRFVVGPKFSSQYRENSILLSS